PASSPATPAKSNVKRSVCVLHAAASSSASADTAPAPGHQKPPASPLGAVFAFWVPLSFVCSLKGLHANALWPAPMEGRCTAHAGAKRAALAAALARRCAHAGPV